ncbi:unnamed protein product, partial [Soboliphyme baturini]|uniref:Chitin-binding type-2 domain-containing protein n=1 Tax=Soboliphyme baturini TaxID=241478 RepID=A0A183ISS9_9BILA
MRELIVALCFAWCSAYYAVGKHEAAVAGVAAAPMPLQGDDGPQCTASTNGKFAMGPCEQAYYECVKGTRMVKTCSDNEVFDITLQQCVLYADAVDCVIADTMEQGDN